MKRFTNHCNYLQSTNKRSYNYNKQSAFDATLNDCNTTAAATKPIPQRYLQIHINDRFRMQLQNSTNHMHQPPLTTGRHRVSLWLHVLFRETGSHDALDLTLKRYGLRFSTDDCACSFENYSRYFCVIVSSLGLC